MKFFKVNLLFASHDNDFYLSEEKEIKGKGYTIYHPIIVAQNKNNSKIVREVLTGIKIPIIEIQQNKVRSEGNYIYFVKKEDFLEASKENIRRYVLTHNNNAFRDEFLGSISTALQLYKTSKFLEENQKGINISRKREK